jgi:HlyD family secretion protein
VQAAQANLAKLTAGPTAAELAIAQQQIESAQNLLYASQGARDALNAVKGNAEYEQAQGQVLSNEVQVRIAELRYEDLKDGPRPEDLQAARAEVARAQAGLQTARGEALRAESGVGVAKAQLEEGQAKRDLVKAGARAEDIQVAEAAVAQSQAALDSARATLEDSILTAPFDGTIGQLNAQVGELASPSLPVLTVGDLSELRVETQDLSEVDVQRVQIGQDVEVSVDAVPGKEFKGKVALIAPQAIERRGDTVYTVKIDLVEPNDPRLRWGMTAFVDVLTGND